MPVQVYGFPAQLPPDVDFVTYSNEDLGFTAAFAAGADVARFALPYPSSMNLWEETMIVHCIEFIKHDRNGPINGATLLGGLTAHLSMLDEQFGDNWGGDLTDTDDEAFKAQFAGPIYFGNNWVNVTAVASVEGSARPVDTNTTAQYFPPVPLNLITPLYVQLTNTMFNITLATNVVGIDDDANCSEQTALRVWFTPRPLSAMEQLWLQQLPTRFQQLDS